MASYISDEGLGEEPIETNFYHFEITREEDFKCSCSGCSFRNKQLKNIRMLFALGFIMPPFWVACAGLLLVNYCSYNTAFQSPHDLKAKLEELFLQNKKNGFISPSHVSKITAMDYYREMANDCLAVSMDMHSRTEANFTKWGYYSILGLCIYFIIGLLIYLIAKHSSFDHL